MQRTRPLEGLRVAVTRAAEQCAEVSDKLRVLGALPVEWPMIALAAPLDRAPLDAAIRRLVHFDWIVFSSANGVKFFCAQAGAEPLVPRTAVQTTGSRSPAGAEPPASGTAVPMTGSRLPAGTLAWPGLLCVAAVGPQTAAALQSRGWPVDAMPEEFLAANLAATMGELDGMQVLLVHPDIASRELAEGLEARGAWVTEVVAYRNVPAAADGPLNLSLVDIVTLASASAATNFAARLAGQSLGPVRIVTIGPATSAAARRAGLPVHAEAQKHTLDGLVEAIVNVERKK